MMQWISQELTRRRFLQAAASTGVVGAWCRYSAFGDELTPSRLVGLDDYVLEAMMRWGVPGLAIAVVEDGNLIHARGYGVRSLGENAKVDTETIFHIASSTKSFTAAAIAKLVDSKQLQWDDPISKHLPAFQLSAPELTAKVTIRQALGHRSGLPTANMLWRSGAFNSDEIVARLRQLQPVAAPGEKFIYNNNMYSVLGKLVEQVSRQTWDEFLRNELFQPLGMKSTLAGCAAIADLENAAAPHALDGGKVRRISTFCPETVAPAGAIYSNVVDMAQWLKLQLESGAIDGRQIISQIRMKEMHTAPQQV